MPQNSELKKGSSRFSDENFPLLKHSVLHLFSRLFHLFLLFLFVLFLLCLFIFIFIFPIYLLHILLPLDATKAITIF